MEKMGGASRSFLRGIRKLWGVIEISITFIMLIESQVFTEVKVD